MISLCALWLVVTVAIPVVDLIARSVQNARGEFVGLQNYAAYFSNAGLFASMSNSLVIASASTLISVALGFIYAFSLTRTCMAVKPVLRAIGLLPLYVPSVAQGIALVYLFGKKGLVTTGFFGAVPGIDIGLYGPVGIILGEVAYCFPQAVLILTVALTLADARLYEASASLRASRLRTLLTVTLPGVRYGLISAASVCFALAITDFGVPKVVGGQYNVLATDIYKQVIGQQNLTMGATISVVLLAPTAMAFLLDRLMQKRQSAVLTASSAPLQPKPSPLRDWLALAICACIGLGIVSMVATIAFASLVDVWPYRLTPSLRHYDFSRVGGGGLGAFWNSLRVAGFTALAGAVAVFGSAYLVEKLKRMAMLRSFIHFASLLPMALPGLVLGLAYIFFFNRAAWQIGDAIVPNPFNALYGTLGILVICNVIHFYTTGFYTASAALKQLDAEFEAVSASLSVPFYITFWRVTLPVCLPALLDIALYFFVNAMVTVSAVIFLYSPDLKLASVAIVNMDDAGDTASAAAMSTLIILASTGARALYEALTQPMRAQAHAWIARASG